MAVAVAVAVAGREGSALHLPRLQPDDLPERAADRLQELRKYQVGGGVGEGLWAVLGVEREGAKGPGAYGGQAAGAQEVTGGVDRSCRAAE